MATLVSELRHNPLLGLLALPVVFVVQWLEPDAHTWLFGLSVLAIVPLATLLSHATKSVAAKTGDTPGLRRGAGGDRREVPWRLPRQPYLAADRAHRPALDEVDPTLAAAALLSAAVEANVRRTVRGRARIARRPGPHGGSEMKLVGAVNELATGRVRFLD